MKTWQITLPYRDNDGRSYASAHDAFQERCIDRFGGFTAFDASGGWRSGEGAVMIERVRVYQVLCEAEPGGFADLFPDQLAFYVGRIGKAVIRLVSDYHG